MLSQSSIQRDFVSRIEDIESPKEKILDNAILPNSDKEIKPNNFTTNSKDIYKNLSTNGLILNEKTLPNDEEISNDNIHLHNIQRRLADFFVNDSK